MSEPSPSPLAAAAAALAPSVATARVLLLPYTPALVPRYHAWMADPWLREMTASERLSEADEVAAQREWARDPSKQTFIVFDRAAREALLARPRAAIGAGAARDAGPSASAGPSAGPGGEGVGSGGAGAGTGAGASGGSGEAGAGAGAGGTFAEEASDDAATAGMCGDVNIFMMDADASADYAPPGAPDVSSAPVCAEIMVMIAEPGCRRRGLASEAVRAMMSFVLRARGVRRFVAKISDTNAASLALFARLGFRVARRMPHFCETHVVLDVGEGSDEFEGFIEHMSL